MIILKKKLSFAFIFLISENKKEKRKKKKLDLAGKNSTKKLPHLGEFQL